MTANRESRMAARRRVLRRRRQAVGFCSALIVLVGFRVAAALSPDKSDAVARGSPASLTVPNLGPARTSPTRSVAPVENAAGIPLAVQPTSVFAVAPGGTARRGSGIRLTYRVEVETGTRQSAPAFAAAVDATLAHPASWTARGRWSLQRVDTARADFTIRLATPATVDQVCATSGLDTHGYVSCRAGPLVMINLDRWVGAVPHYLGDVALYRNYVINHEVGHVLGLGHQGCSGKGRLAPVMQQQTFGLNGCRPNGWPYVAGVFVSGPAAR
jgi:hypothetical protein